ncbi:metal-sulfur cluster assembly factor [Candidatus Uhrbacteria bacterium]|nr:metal-sulfur cluster assembly factor [Candidatus Uhrbacteria bacterium]
MDEKKVIPVPREKQTGEYWKALNTVIDPELDVGIVDLGLVYDVSVKKGIATVTMTLTSMGCPAGPEIMRSIEAELGQCSGIKDVKVNLVWEPIWGPDRVHEAIRDLLFGME